MTLSEIRGLLKQRGYKRTKAINRVDVKRDRGTIIGADVMFTDDTVTYLPAAQ
ncbi:hypothetical protein [Curtobacterium sp. KT1]|uniref:hypothetical protein n=1 Tax=Curtobacterium sp. KT1 TaxID=3372858 RepID=UPI0037C157F4